MKVAELLISFMLKVAFLMIEGISKLSGAVLGALFSALWNWWQGRRAVTRSAFQRPQQKVVRHKSNRYRRRHHVRR